MLEAFAASFIAIALAEFADKTQLAVLALSSRYSERTDHLRIFAGAFLGFALADGLAILFGGLISSYVSVSAIQVFSGLAFVAFGLLFLYTKGDGAEKLGNGGSFMVAFSMVALNEFGDKTQLASMVLAARFSQALPVFLGVMLALGLLTLMAIACGKRVCGVVPEAKVKKAAGAVFILLGLSTLLGY